MNRSTAVVRAWRRAIPLLTAVVLIGGCSSTKRVDDDSALVTQDREFQQSLVLTTESINQAELESARTHLRTARSLARTQGQRRKVQSLHQLLNGAEALMAGEPVQAQEAWSQIKDPRLKQEVQQKASTIGMNQNATPVETGESEVDA
ncbi:MAG: hypothetical protein ACYTGC_04220 [Planctomycetota bacterium]|jgi:hypothetical protein